MTGHGQNRVVGTQNAATVATAGELQAALAGDHPGSGRPVPTPAEKVFTGTTDPADAVSTIPPRNHGD